MPLPTAKDPVSSQRTKDGIRFWLINPMFPTAKEFFKTNKQTNQKQK